MFDRRPARASCAITLAAVVASIVGCTDANPTAVARPAGAGAGRFDVSAAGAQSDPAAPSPLVTVAVGNTSTTFFPYTGDDFTGAPKDPINAIFTGYADPLQIRAALRRLDGNRTAFGLPAAPPFNCTWKDAIGDEQTGYGTAEGWTGSAVQLACGEYSPFRFHMRLFRNGSSTFAGVHMDLHIAGTNEHEAIAWELPEQILVVDMIRSGILGAAPGLSAPITQTPTFREIRAPVWAAMPAQLKALVGVTTGPAIPNDGRARLFQIAVAEPVVADVVEQDFIIQFNQVIPKPFCAGPTDFVFVQGPLHFTGDARVTPAGTYHRQQRVTAELSVLPVNPLTGQPIGAPLNAHILDEHVAGFGPGGADANMRRLQQLFDAEGTLVASLDDKLSAGTRGHNDFSHVVRCAP